MVSQYEHGPELETPIEGQCITTKIKQVARAIYERDISDDSIPDELKWDDLASWQKQEFYGMAQVAIEAMCETVKGLPPSEAVLQNDLREFRKILGLPDTAIAKSPHHVFQDCLEVLKMRLNYKEVVAMEKKIEQPVGVSKELITFRRVTSEPTPEQLQAGGEAHDENGLPVGNYVGNYALLRIYRAMIEAAPPETLKE